jgi:phosphoribosyl-AMP cyclohydrolase / phosphoribosyl-ATP pyrophosphohydrolase
MLADYSVLRFNEHGLIPAIVQDVATGRVLMLAYMNREALERTLSTRLVHYWSRSRAQLWQKGETSGHIQHLRDLRYDCDADTLLVIVEQEGAACHTGEPSCFFQRFAETSEPMQLPVSAGLLQQIYAVVQERKRRAPQESYVASLMARGKDHVLKKVIEEAAEVLMASKDGRREAIVYEMADLWFHAIVALGWHDISPQEVLQELQRRFGKSGLRTNQRPPLHTTPEQSA